MKSQKCLPAFVVISLFATIFLITFVAAESYELWCLVEGQTADLAKLCNPAMKPRKGPVNLCMHKLNNGKTCPVSPNVCNSLGLKCSAGDNSTLDTSAPNMTLRSPKQNAIFKSKSVPFDFSLSEKSSVYFINNNDQRRGWNDVCTSCTSFNSPVKFPEGLNDITLKIIDKSGNINFLDLKFFIDTKKPKITKVEPTKYFASGTFYVTFQELNPKSLVLKYGISSNMSSKTLNLTLCDYQKTKTVCEVTANLSKYDSQNIQFWFELTDITGSLAKSKPITLPVDITPPKINSFNYTLIKNSATVTLDVTEKNLDYVSYINQNDLSPREKKLCTRLSSSKCTKSIKLRPGSNAITFIAYDKADQATAIQRTISL